MKYPQLVSTRAVNAISDWLVSRLEQLGVEAPQIYARFLLSLLQSSVQINDPIEYSNLETFIASRKGNNRRLHQLLGDSETLKKLTAVQCLQGIVSPDQEISTIESLVEELCGKLKEFEQQNSGINEDATLLLTSQQEPQEEQELLKNQKGKKEISHNLNTRVIGKNRIRAGRLDSVEGGSDQAQSTSSVVTETDPKKRYFSAFPALSKGMDEESFRALRKNAKSLTWPVERKQSEQSAAQIAQNSSDSSNSSIYQTAVTGGSAGEQKLTEKTEDRSGGSESAGAVVKSTTKVRRRSRRRRNQALKTKSMEQKSNSKTKTTAKSGGYFGEIGESEATKAKVDIVAHNAAHKGKRKERYSTPANWDTDFEGCWEMGRDLIQEFIKKQNNRNERNRSTSESAAYVKKGVNVVDMQDIQELKQKSEMTPLALDLEYYYGNAAKDLSADINEQTEEEDYTLASVAELSLNVGVGGTEPRRLYERDTGIDKKNAEEETEHDFEQFKAKFNSSVEALWKDAEPVQPIAEKSAVSHAKLKSFWSHYFQEQTLVAEADVKPLKDTAIGSMSLTTQATELVANTSDYYSMPSTWDEVDKATMPRKTVLPVGASLYASSYGRNTESTTPVGVFLNTNSIWSDQPKSTVATNNNDDNFFYKVWNANQTLTQLDTNTENKTREKAVNLNKTYLKTGDGYPPFSVSKWSEGINAGPINSSNNNNFGFVDATESSTTTTTDSASASTTSCSSSMYPWPQHVWQAAGVVNQHVATNTVMSLTDMYARDTVDNSNASSTATSSLNSPAVENVKASQGPKVTLGNHAFNGNSAFVEYARIKSVVKKTHNYAAPIMRKNYHNNMDLMYNSNENLLTSEITHFQPIRTYRDGHVFNICSAWDSVQYERSASGYLCLGADKYLEYKRNDNYAVEDDAVLAARSGNASTAPLYASSNCDAATSMRQRKTDEVHKKKPFVLKFRVIDNCEIGCQTEDPALIAAAAAAEASTKARINALKMTEQHPLAALFAGGARTGMNPRAMPKTGIACSDALESLNKAIATAAKTRTQRAMVYNNTKNIINNNNNNNNSMYQNFNNNNEMKRNNDLLLMTVDQTELDWLPATKVAQHVAAGVKNEMYKAKSAADLWPVFHVEKVEKDQKAEIKNIVVMENKSAYCDEVDYCLSDGKKSPWSMRAIGKKCQQNEQSKRKRLKNNNNNNGSNDDDDDDNDDPDDEHTLWGMCAACHTENKALSLPANRLLRDELNQEADEIMNELKNMQDLYIGRDPTDATDDDDNDDEEFDADEEKSVKQQQIISNWCNYSPLIVQQQQNKIKDKNKPGLENTNKVLLQMNEFIEDWLRPATLQGDNYDIWYTNKNKSTVVDDKTINETQKCVWQKDIQSIWQINDDDDDDNNNEELQMDKQEEEECIKKKGLAAADTWKPLDLLLQLNADAAEAPPQPSRDDTFLSKLSWEHENLAAIWNNSTPLPIVQHVDENENNINEKSNYVKKNQQPSERVKAFLKHLGFLNHKSEQNAVTVTTHNTPKLTIAATTTGNRKRRHSESLSFVELMATGAKITKDKFDLDKLKDVIANDGICCKKTTKIVDTNLDNLDYGNDKNDNGNGNNNNNNNGNDLVVDGEYGFDVQKQHQQKTVITCKYWSTEAATAGNNNNKKQYENIDSIIDIDINDELIGNFAMNSNNLEAQFSCQFDKNNASILRHVTTAMITRPLTR